MKQRILALHNRCQQLRRSFYERTAALFRRPN